MKPEELDRLAALYAKAHVGETDGFREFSTVAFQAFPAMLEAARNARRLELALAQAEKVVRLSDELCGAIDAAAEDVGGFRPIADILAELGPATDAALATIKELRDGK